MAAPSKRMKDLSGMRFARLSVVAYSGNDRHGKAIWECLCDCGKTTTPTTSDLTTGHTTSCGCSRIGKTGTPKHGMFDTPEYNAWRAMKSRCYNKNNKGYPLWGGRGIRVCDQWVNSFEQFHADMGMKPGPDYSIDRIDNDGDYTPDNCRWATLSEQNANKRPASKNACGVKGVRFNKAAGKWVAQITRDGIQHYLGRFSNADGAIDARLAAEARMVAGG